MTPTEKKVVARPREAYARVWNAKNGFEISIGLEYADDKEIDSLNTTLNEWASKAHQLAPDAAKVVSYLETKLRTYWPSRAFFIETEREGKGVQVFQPYGIPKGD